MHFFPLSRYCTFQNSWTWEIPQGEIHVELVDLASLWTCFAPAEGAEIFGHPNLSIFPLGIHLLPSKVTEVHLNWNGLVLMILMKLMILIMLSSLEVTYDIKLLDMYL